MVRFGTGKSRPGLAGHGTARITILGVTFWRVQELRLAKGYNRLSCAYTKMRRCDILGEVQRGELRAAVMFLLREYLQLNGTKHAGYVDHIAGLRDDEDILRAAVVDQKDILKAKLDEASSHLKTLKGH